MKFAWGVDKIKLTVIMITFSFDLHIYNIIHNIA